MTQRRWLTDDERDRIKRLRDGGLSLAEIALRLRRSKSTIEKVVRRGFVRKRNATPPAPPCFGLYGATETVDELCARYSRGKDTIRRWIKEKGIARPDLRYHAAYRHRPDDFAELAPSMTIGQAEAHWKACYPLIVRWRAEIGLERPRAGLRDRAAAANKMGWADRYHQERAA